MNTASQVFQPIRPLVQQQGNVLLSGASGGLGTVVTGAFLRAGWRVYGVSMHAESSKRLCAQYATESASGQLVGLVADLSERDQARSVVRTVLRSIQADKQTDDQINTKSAALHAVVCLAGGIRAGVPIEETDDELLDGMMRLNFKTAFHLIAAALPALKSCGGAVVTIGAQAARRGDARKAAYIASKAALEALTKVVASEGWANNLHKANVDEQTKEPKHRLRAACYLPDILNTPANREWGAPEEIASWTQPESVARLLVEFCQGTSSTAATKDTEYFFVY